MVNWSSPSLARLLQVLSHLVSALVHILLIARIWAVVKTVVTGQTTSAILELPPAIGTGQGTVMIMVACSEESLKDLELLPAHMDSIPTTVDTSLPQSNLTPRWTTCMGDNNGN